VAKIFLRAFAEAAERLTHHGEAISESHSSEEEETSVIATEVADENNLAPVFDANGEILRVSDGDSITINAKYHGAPCHTAQWMLDGRPVNQDKNITAKHSPGHVELHIQSPSAGSAGNYECRIENAYGAALYTCAIQWSRLFISRPYLLIGEEILGGLSPEIPLKKEPEKLGVNASIKDGTVDTQIFINRQEESEETIARLELFEAIRDTSIQVREATKPHKHRETSSIREQNDADTRLEVEKRLQATSEGAQDLTEVGLQTTIATTAQTISALAVPLITSSATLIKAESAPGLSDVEKEGIYSQPTDQPTISIGDATPSIMTEKQSVEATTPPAGHSIEESLTPTEAFMRIELLATDASINETNVEPLPELHSEVVNEPTKDNINRLPYDEDSTGQKPLDHVHEIRQAEPDEHRSVAANDEMISARQVEQNITVDLQFVGHTCQGAGFLLGIQPLMVYIIDAYLPANKADASQICAIDVREELLKNEQMAPDLLLTTEASIELHRIAELFSRDPSVYDWSDNNKEVITETGTSEVTSAWSLQRVKTKSELETIA